MRIVVTSLLALLLSLVSACNPGSTEGPSEQDPKGGYALGKVTFEDGSPITGDVRDYMISISGISEAGEKVGYTPIVKDGTYMQKLVPGQFRFNAGKIKVRFAEADFMLDLVPVGPNWDKNQDSADGIVQDFVWKPTGLRETYGEQANPNNATHWHGLNVGLLFQTWRSDTKQAPTVLPEGTKLVFTLVPTSNGIDGSELKPITIERDWRPKDTTPNDDLNDLMPANYDLTGVAKLPDGTDRPILLQGNGVYPNYTTVGKVTVEYDGILGGMWKQSFGWVTD